MNNLDGSANGVSSSNNNDAEAALDFDASGNNMDI